MIWIQWIAGIILSVFSAWIICMNGLTFWERHIQHKKTPSWIPLLGGLSGTVGLLILPVIAIKHFWWLPLILDWGSFPGIFYAILWHLFRDKTNDER